MLRRTIVVLGLFLAVSCGRKENPGTPYILYEIHGNVVDQAGKPIEGIKVTSGSSEADMTSVNGEFVIFGKSVPATYGYVTVVCEDIDGDSNGGAFMKTTKSVELRLRSAGSGNNKGNYFASQVLVSMIPKNDGLQNGNDAPTPN